MSRSGALSAVFDKTNRSEEAMIIHVVALLFTPILAALVLAPAVPAQKSEKVYRFGWVALFPPPEKLPPAFEALKARLAERGYIEGKNIMFEGRWANNDYQRVPELLADLERNGVDVIFPLN
jgi:hypothetical protein